MVRGHFDGSYIVICDDGTMWDYRTSGGKWSPIPIALPGSIADGSAVQDYKQTDMKLKKMLNIDTAPAARNSQGPQIATA